MFLGHVALGLAAKRAAPGTSLGILVLAAQLADTVWPVFVALGVEQVAIDPGNTRVTPLNFISYPYSHSLLTMALWALAFAYPLGLAVILGPPPPSVAAVWVSGLAGAVLLTAWAWWADRHRVSRRV